MDSNIITISCAAIKYSTTFAPKIDEIVTGNSHADCISWFSMAGIWKKDRVNEVQGFMTNKGDFVGREKAYIIAEKAGQLIAPNTNRVLYSENVNYII